MDFEFYKPATITGNRDGIYINPCNNTAFIDIRNALNYKDIDFSGVNNICVHRYDNGDFYIFATGGYTPEKGLFTQQYKYK